MNEMSEKRIYRILNTVSLLALTYYAATSIYYIFQSDAHIYSYDNLSYSKGSTAQLEAHRASKQYSLCMNAKPIFRKFANC